MKIEAVCEVCDEEIALVEGKVVCACSFCEGCGNLHTWCDCDELAEADHDLEEAY